MTREEVRERWRALRAMKARADQKMLELALHPSATPAQVQEAIACAREAHEKCKAVQTALINKYGNGWQ